jgi:hypothetical protein
LRPQLQSFDFESAFFSLFVEIDSAKKEVGGPARSRLQLRILRAQQENPNLGGGVRTDGLFFLALLSENAIRE